MIRACFAVILAALTCGPALAQSFPARPVTMIVPFGAGGPTDALARIVAERMRIALGQTVVVENVTGASGTIGMTRASRAAPDGYTILLGNWPAFVVATATFALPYDVRTDFEAIALLPGRKLVFTNGDEPYARRVLERIGLSQAFEAIHDIHAMSYEPKPHVSAYASMLKALGVDPTRALFAEDMARNLKPAKVLGMTTLWVDNGSEQVGAGQDHIDYTTGDLGHWLAGILEDKT